MRGRSLAIATALVAVTPFLQACTTRDVIEVEIASVEIEPPSPIVTGGATVQLTATVSDDGGTVIPQAVVEWSSDDETIATVDDTGRVWGKGAGTTMIRASFRGVNGTASITVQPGPSIGAIPDSVSLFGTQASSPSAAVQIENRGVGTLSGLQASVEYEGAASGWLPVTLAGSTAPTTLTLTAVTSGLSVGSYRALVWLAGVAENSPLRVPVNLTVTENEPIIELTPSSLTMEGVQGRPPSGPAMVQVTNAENGSLTGLSTSVWYVGSAAGWLSAALASSTAPTEVSVFTDARALPPGTYRGEVRVASPGAVNDPEAISVTFVVAPAPEVADLSVSISGPPATTSGSRIEYVATVRNDGPDSATSVQATFTIPSGASFVSSSAGAHAGGIVTWSVGALPPGGPQSLTIVLDVGASTTGTLVSSASVSSATADPSLENNAASATTTVSPPAADVSVLKSGPASAQVGSRIAYTLRVANAGPDDAETVAVVDTMPSGTTFVSSTGGTHSNRIVSWSVGSLAGGASREIDVVVELAPATVGDVTNRAHVRAGTPDPAGGNNTSAVTTAVSAAPSADLVAGVSAPASASADTQMTLIATVANRGPDDAAVVVLEATLPAGTSFVSASGGGTHVAGVVTWSLGTLTVAQGTRSFGVTVAIGSGTTGNVTSMVTATTASSDSSPADNTASATTFVLASNQADVSVTVTGPSTAGPEEVIRYDVTVTNHGPAKASGVDVANAIPAQTTFVFATRGSHRNGVVEWSHKSISRGSSVTTSIWVRVAAGASGNITDTAVASTDTDPIQSNNTGQQTTSVSPAPGG